MIEQERVTVVLTAPAILARLTDWPDLEKFDTRALRAIRTGAAALPLSVAQAAERRLDCVVVKAGGSMETCSFGQVSIDDPPEIRHGEAIGRVMPGGEVRIVDPNGNPLPPGSAGELWIRGAATSSGYFRDPKTTEEAWGTLGPEGWFRTGDVATLDGGGYVLCGMKHGRMNRAISLQAL